MHFTRPQREADGILTSHCGIMHLVFMMAVVCSVEIKANAQPMMPLHPRLYINYASDPDPKVLAQYNYCILDPDSEVDLAPGHARGDIYLAYASTVEVNRDTPPFAKAKARGIPRLARNEGWDADVLDVTHPEWLDYMVEDVAASAIKKGYDGLMLDTLDSVEFITAKHPEKIEPCRAALVALIHKLHERFPNKLIVLNRGFFCLDYVLDTIHGVLLEGLYQEWNPDKKTYYNVTKEDTEWLMKHIRRVQAKGLPVFVVDYVSPENTTLAKRTAERIQEAGCIPLISTPKLNGVILAPIYAKTESPKAPKHGENP
jgi:polysaccharide biosynthesis protein PelA